MRISFSPSSSGVAVSVWLLCFGQVQAGGIGESIRLLGGTLACGDNHFSRLAGSEQHRTAYVLPNFSRYASITIDRFQVFDANGNVLFDYPDVGLPASVKTELGPHDSMQINTADLLFEDLSSDDRPTQARVESSYQQGQKDISLNGSAVRSVLLTSTGAEQSRASSECRPVEFER
jgi:hypothetical protein